MKKNRLRLQMECGIIDFNAKLSPFVQAFKIAMYDSLKLHYMYSKILDKFNFLEPFEYLKGVEEENLRSFSQLLNKYEIKPLKNSFACDIWIPHEPLECL